VNGKFFFARSRSRSISLFAALASLAIDNHGRIHVEVLQARLRGCPLDTLIFEIP